MWVHTNPDSLGSNPLVTRTERTSAPSSWLKGMQGRSSFVCACLVPTNLNCSYTNSASTGLCISKLSINRYCITFLPCLPFAKTDGRGGASIRTVLFSSLFLFLVISLSTLCHIPFFFPFLSAFLLKSSILSLLLQVTTFYMHTNV